MRYADWASEALTRIVSKASKPINDRLEGAKPVTLIAATLAAAYLLPKVYRGVRHAISGAGDVVQDAKKRGAATATKQALIDGAYAVVQKQPFAAPKDMLAAEIDKEKRGMFESKRQKALEEEKALREAGVVLRDSLPRTPVELSEFDPITARVWRDYKRGATSGANYAAWGEADMASMARLFKTFAYTNPLHESSWPIVQALHNKAIHIGARLLHDDNAYGVITTGGTGSIVEACYAYVRHARVDKGIARPRIVVPVTAHVAFDTAAEMMDVELVKVAINPVTKQVDVEQMRKAINGSTVLLVGSAPNYPYGTFDDIAAIAAMAKERGIGCHVDACLGAFITMFAEAAGFDDLPVCDFRIEGVTSISGDFHKYGNAPKGASGLWFRRALPALQHLTRVYMDWLGGLYVKPGQEGSRTGLSIATVYHCLLRMAHSGYTEQAKQVITLTRQLADCCRKHADAIRVTGRCCVVSFEANDLPSPDSIYVIAEHMNDNGWELCLLEGGVHFTVTKEHALDSSIVARFERDLGLAIEHVRSHPGAKPHGVAKAYGKFDTGMVPHKALQSIGHAFQEVTNTDTSQFIRWLRERDAMHGVDDDLNPRSCRP